MLCKLEQILTERQTEHKSFQIPYHVFEFYCVNVYHASMVSTIFDSLEILELNYAIRFLYVKNKLEKLLCIPIIVLGYSLQALNMS